MEDGEFWGLIEESRPISVAGGQEAQIGWLTARLAATSSERIKSFYRHWLVAMDRAYFWDLWGAAYLATRAPAKWRGDRLMSGCP